ncbi:CBO0543 family protein [Alicyclobacillus contaminans]|uniref:CBO0543 family protein n=1 Tax=Alicyclobacillus contaminans TaxID=392016 RepID=UPI00042859A7|nr:CBO0543 family protein [Alicyclobacillus contaminans]
MGSFATWWVVEFVLPWVVGVYLWRRDSRAVVTVVPCAVAVSFLFNLIGFNMEWWSMVPRTRLETTSALPLNLGLYPVAAATVWFFVRRGLHPVAAVGGSALFLTLCEEIAVIIGRVQYHHGWNIACTFASYVLALILVVLYARLVDATDIP